MRGEPTRYREVVLTSWDGGMSVGTAIYQLPITRATAHEVSTITR